MRDYEKELEALRIEYIDQNTGLARRKTIELQAKALKAAQRIQEKKKGIKI